MSAVTIFKRAYEQGVKLALDESKLPEYMAAKEAGIRVETPGVPVERPLHHDVKYREAARFGHKGREVEQKRAEAEPDYIARARDYADRYHKSLLARFKTEHEAKEKPMEPVKAADYDGPETCEHGKSDCDDCCKHGVLPEKCALCKKSVKEAELPPRLTGLGTMVGVPLGIGAAAMAAPEDETSLSRLKRLGIGALVGGIAGHSAGYLHDSLVHRNASMLSDVSQGVYKTPHDLLDRALRTKHSF